tara:strand:+ start:167 stop:1021 length:855 start_codon:yes stop_codon:yes gene_type:complete
MAHIKPAGRNHVHKRDTLGAGKIYRMYRKSEVMVETPLAIQLACVAYRLNKRTHVKSQEAYYAALDAKYEKHVEHQRSSRPRPFEADKTSDNVNRVVIMANRDHMVLAYDDLQEDREVEITAKDKELAEDITSYFQGLLFKQLSGNMSQFNHKVLKVINEERIPINEFGLIASLPKAFFNSKKWDKAAEIERDLADVSDYVGTQGKRCNFDLQVVSTRHIPTHDCTIVTCVDEDNNVVKFFTHNFAMNSEPGDKFKIAGFVKSHEVSKYNGGSETMINRVKLRT